MNTRLLCVAALMGSVVLAALGVQPGGDGAGAAAPNSLSRAEKAAGWKLLFDGKATGSWRGYKQKGFPENGWVVEDGCIRTVAGAGGGDIITVAQYSDFELELEWKAAENANSGIFYRVTEKNDTTWQTGPEFQLLDDAGNNVAPTDPHSAGALYDLAAPAAGKTLKPAGQFNLARIVLKDGLLQHWLNGAKVVECRIDGDEWHSKIAGSKFKAYEGFGVQPRGHIALQEHGDTVWFRSIRVRDLTAPMPGEMRLFNGKDMSGWKAVLPDNGKVEDVWSVQDGTIVCKGQPVGYIRTEKDYTNYVLRLEWRFNPVTKKAGNSGVLLRMTGADKVWPRCVEAQLESGNAGDFWNIDDFPMRTDSSRTSGRNTKKTGAAERPVGEWNEYEITVDGGNIVLRVNGQEVNRAWEAQEIAGKICLQSEGAEIHFRNVRLAPIE